MSEQASFLQEGDGVERVRHHWQLSESNERYTPAEIIELARKTMGEIALDPASNPVCNQYIGAAKYFTKEQDGMRQEWHGNVWLNPPYGKTGNQSNVNLWAQKLINEIKLERVDQACFLCDVRHLALEHVQTLMSGELGTGATLLTNHRIKFLSLPGARMGSTEHADQLEVQASPPSSNAIIYVGPYTARFALYGQELGTPLMGVQGMLVDPGSVVDLWRGYTLSINTQLRAHQLDLFGA